MAGTDAQTFRVVEDGEAGINPRPIEQRLSHSHVHHVGRRQVGMAQDDLPGLSRDFKRSEVAAKPHSTRRAEDAPEGTASL